MRRSSPWAGIAALALLVWGPGSAAAQTAPAQPVTTPAPAGSPSEPSPEAMRIATEIVDKTAQNREATIRAMSAPLAGMMQQMGIRQPDRAKTLVDEVLTPMLSQHIDDLFKLQARSYATTLSLDDLKGLNDFYATPAGRDVLALQPALASNLLSNTTAWMRGLAPELQSRMQAAMKAHGWDKAP